MAAVTIQSIKQIRVYNVASVTDVMTKSTKAKCQVLTGGANMYLVCSRSRTGRRTTECQLFQRMAAATVHAVTSQKVIADVGDYISCRAPLIANSCVRLSIIGWRRNEINVNYTACCTKHASYWLVHSMRQIRCTDCLCNKGNLM